MLTAVIRISTGTIVLSSISVYVNRHEYIKSKTRVIIIDIPIPFKTLISPFPKISFKMFSSLNLSLFHFYSSSYKIFTYRILFNYKGGL
jgi:hypothetical protein